jgi:MinD-like ATPase involved in chromosome partitioning or flagellar assembly
MSVERTFLPALTLRHYPIQVHVLSVSSLKGGVGKTTVALGLASAAFARGLRTLVVDLDPQCDASTGLGAVSEFRETSAEVLENPKHNVVHRSIVASSWSKIRSGKIDVMIGSARLLAFDKPNPTLKDVWKLEEALSRVEKDYDLVIIDTPPSINGLTRTAWVSSDRVLIVTEPAIFSVVAAERAMRAIEELRKGLTPRLKALGVVINRVRPKSKEHEFRIQELNDLFGDELIKVQIEERSTIQQAQGAARAIHTWPGEQAAEISEIFDELLDGAMVSFAQPVDKRAVKSERRFAKLSQIMRGQKFNDALAAEKAGLSPEQTLDEVISELVADED